MSTLPYQQIAEDERRPGLYREYPQDFFDLVVVDECHRGSARDESTWREILDWFTGAAKLGMTATPFRQETRNTYEYFGDPVVEYSLAQGIDDGFLAPYRVRRVVTDVDAVGWRPERGQLDRHGQPIPDDQYATTDFERSVSLTQRTDVMAQWLTGYLQSTSPLDKTIIFCVGQEHAQQMRDALARLNPEMVRQYPDWVCRVTADEGAIGRTHLDNFQDVDRSSPAVLTTSEMLTTGVDAPTTMNVVLCRVVGSMAEFKQIIGRGTRLRTDYGKWYFTIVDFTGTATVKFADPTFDGDPVDETDETIDRPPRPELDAGTRPPDADRPPSNPYRKFYVDGVEVHVVADLAYELDADGRRLRTVKYIEYAGERVRTICRSNEDLRSRWADPRVRSELVDELEARGVDLAYLPNSPTATVTSTPSTCCATSLSPRLCGPAASVRRRCVVRPADGRTSGPVSVPKRKRSCARCWTGTSGTVYSRSSYRRSWTSRPSPPWAASSSCPTASAARPRCSRPSESSSNSSTLPDPWPAHVRTPRTRRPASASPASSRLAETRCVRTRASTGSWTACRS